MKIDVKTFVAAYLIIALFNLSWLHKYRYVLKYEPLPPIVYILSGLIWPIMGVFVIGDMLAGGVDRNED